MSAIGKDINKAKQLLEQGELVGIPTETVYGLGGNALNPKSVTRIFEVKKRPEFDPLIIHVSSFQKVDRYTKNIPDSARELAKVFWPGPLTLLLERKSVVPDLVTAGLPRVGIRCPDHPLTHALLDAVDFPLAAPSANPFGYVSPTTPEHVNEQLGDKISYILDGGPCRVGIESTIVGFDKDGGVIYRSGGISAEHIERVIGKVKNQLNSSSNPKTPGQLLSHYAPAKRIIVGNVETLMEEATGKRVGVLTFSKNYQLPYQYVLSASGNMEEAARNFFSALRALDKLPIDVILAEFVPETGLGRAINDRLRRASYRTSDP
jgi:L-threonylcarbamoyladenylate synthase